MVNLVVRQETARI